MAHQGDAGFTYTPPGGVLTTVLLNLPLKDVRPAHNQTHWVRESLDLTTRQVVTLGNGVYEISAVIRCQTAPDALIEMLKHGRNGSVLTYYPSMAVPGTSFAALLIMAGTVSLAPDPDRFGFNEWQSPVILRRTGGLTWAGLL